jgi:hypothetical protein
MTPDTLLAVIVTLLVATTVGAALAWTRHGEAFNVVMIGATTAAASAAWLAPEITQPGQYGHLMIVCSAAGAATLGGGPLTTQLFKLIDGPRPQDNQSLETAGKVLRGGAWIGVFERLTVFAAALLHAPEAIAVVLALKGVGRYQELHGEMGSGATAERFIIGTFSSLLWSLALAGIALKVI